MTANIFPKRYLNTTLGNSKNKSFLARYKGVWEKTPDGKIVMWCGPTVGGVEIGKFKSNSVEAALALMYMQAHIATLQELDVVGVV